jgi:hypothetical protein
MRRSLLVPPPPALQLGSIGRPPSLHQDPGAERRHGDGGRGAARSRTLSAADETAASLLLYPSSSLNPVYDDQALDADPGGAPMVDVQLSEPAPQHAPMGRAPTGQRKSADTVPLYHSSPYSYNLETGLLEKGGSSGPGGRAARTYIEDRSTGERDAHQGLECCAAARQPAAMR